MAVESKPAIFAAICGNLALAVIKFVAAGWTASSAMLTEGIHSTVDTGNGVLLLVGIHRSKRPADEGHPFGHGLELYFWTLIVSILIFGVGGGVSVYEGILHLLNTEPIRDAFWNYIVLGCGVVFEGISWVVALKGFVAVKGRRGVWEVVRNTKDPTLLAVLFEDSAALLGLFVAFLGIFFGQVLDNPYLDGTASIIIGVILMGVASVLVHESRKLLIGESADPQVVASIQRIVNEDRTVERAGKPLTMHLGPREILVNLDVQFCNDLSVGEMESAIDRLEKNIRRQHAEVARIFIETRSIVAKGSSHPTD